MLHNICIQFFISNFLFSSFYFVSISSFLFSHLLHFQYTHTHDFFNINFTKKEWNLLLHFVKIFSGNYIKKVVRGNTLSPHPSQMRFFFSVYGLFNSLTVTMDKYKTSSSFSICYSKQDILWFVSHLKTMLLSFSLVGDYDKHGAGSACAASSSHGVGPNSISTSILCPWFSSGCDWTWPSFEMLP